MTNYIRHNSGKDDSLHITAVITRLPYCEARKHIGRDVVTVRTKIRLVVQIDHRVMTLILLRIRILL